VGAAWRIVDWGEDIPTTCEGSRGNRIVGEDSPVGWSLLGTRPRSENSSICILVEAEVDGKMKVQDTLEVIEIEAFHISASRQLSHDHNQQLQDYFDDKASLICARAGGDQQSFKAQQERILQKIRCRSAITLGAVWEVRLRDSAARCNPPVKVIQPGENPAAMPQ